MSLGGTDLNLMVALRALLEEGNVTKAGAKIGKSQPAMSTALARLRRHYQDELLVRVGRDYELTPFAKALVPSVQQTMQCVELALDTGQRFDPATSRHAFRIDATDYAITVLAEPLLRRMAEVAPGIRLDFDAIPDDMHESEHGLRNCDALIGPLGFGFPGSQAPLFRDRFVCVVDPANPRLRGRAAHPGRPVGAAARGAQLRAHARHARRPGHGRAGRPAADPGDDRRVPAAAVPRRGHRPGRGHPGTAGAAGGGAARPDGGRAAVRPGGADRDPVVASRTAPSTPEHAWLRRILTEAAASLPPVAADFPVSRQAPQARHNRSHNRRRSPWARGKARQRFLLLSASAFAGARYGCAFSVASTKRTSMWGR